MRNWLNILMKRNIAKVVDKEATLTSDKTNTVLEKEPIEVYTYANCKVCNYRTNFEVWSNENTEDVIKFVSCSYCGANLKTGKLDKYTVVTFNNLSGLIKLVNVLMKKGFKPLGRLTKTVYWYYQPMLRTIKRKR